MKANKLSVNIKKTNYIVFTSRQKILSKNAYLFSDKQQLEQKQESKFLGVYIHENLSWKSHINFVCNEMAKSVRIIIGHVIYCLQILNYLFIRHIYPYVDEANPVRLR